MNISNDFPEGLKLLDTLHVHKQEINRIAWSPDGETIASSSFDGVICMWNVQTGVLAFLGDNNNRVYSVSWQREGNKLAACSKYARIHVWDLTLQNEDIHQSVHKGDIFDVAWSPHGNLLASCSDDKTIKVWEPKESLGRARTLSGANTIYCIAWSPNNPILLASGSSSGTIRIWDTANNQVTMTLRGHSAAVCNVVWSPDGVLLASGSEDHTIRLWDARTGNLVSVLEGHTDAVTGVSFSYDGRLLASKSRDGTVHIWRTDTWETVAKIANSASDGMFAGLAFHPTTSQLAIVGDGDMVVDVWELDVPYLLGLTPIQPSIQYRNAKVVLVGESGVGKSGLALVLAGQLYARTDSTHGRYVWNFDRHEETLDAKRRETRETLLWDLAGQPGYRLVHQLHLNEVAVALVVFDAHSTTDPFVGIPHWIRALRMAQNAQGNTGFPLKKLLVAARIDRGRVKVSRERIKDFVKQWGFDDYIETSALEGHNISALSEAIKQAIAWERLPKVTSTDLFQQIKTFLVTQKEEKRVLSILDDLYQEFLHVQQTNSGDKTLQKDLWAEFATCISLVESQGLIRRLTFGNLILLQPELLDSYASALVNAARSEPDELGSISEERVKVGDFFIPEGERIPNWQFNKEQEKLLLIAMIEDLLRHEIALREEQGVDEVYLVFPSEAVRENPNMPDPEGKAVIFHFEGPVQNIYTTLAVRLSHSGLFTRQALWKNAITYNARVGGLCGLFLQEAGEGSGTLTLFFDQFASEETRFQFEQYVKAHLELRALPNSIQRERIFICPECKLPLDSERVRRRREKYTWMNCSLCDVRISLLDEEERLPALQPVLASEIAEERLVEMDRAADSGVKREADIVTVQGKQATNDFDVFLCHHGIDKSEVKKIGQQLMTQGILPWLDEWELRPGLRWQRLLEQQIGQIKSAAVFVGKNGIGPWTQLELEAFLQEFVTRGCPVIPIILPDASAEPQLPIFLRGMTWIDFRKHDPDPMKQLLWGITGKRDLST